MVEGTDFSISERVLVIINHTKYPLVPCSVEEEMVMDYIKDVMGDGREHTAMPEFMRHSRDFTIPENTLHYSDDQFHKARAKYICLAFDEEMKIWPQH